MGAWLKNELSGYLDTVLSREAIERRGFFAWPAVEKAIAMHRRSERDYTDHLLALMNFELWCRVYLDRVALSDISESLRERAVG
jgi:asparagine synthase (glutamine-hydrolysing)